MLFSYKRRPEGSARKKQSFRPVISVASFGMPRPGVGNGMVYGQSIRARAGAVYSGRGSMNADLPGDEIDSKKLSILNDLPFASSGVNGTFFNGIFEDADDISHDWNRSQRCEYPIRY